VPPVQVSDCVCKLSKTLFGVLNLRGSIGLLDTESLGTVVDLGSLSDLPTVSDFLDSFADFVSTQKTSWLNSQH
jgi:hypothetical protein